MERGRERKREGEGSLSITKVYRLIRQLTAWQSVRPSDCKSSKSFRLRALNFPWKTTK